ncbi:MAG: GxxExxY protein [Acidobacteriota bacterium]|nr:GxxExxY protein [Acidobacteriota bacterium]
MTRTIGCALRVHQTLGPGFHDAVYQDALAVELELEGLPFEREFQVAIFYRGRQLRTQRLDLVVDRRVVVELKAVEQLQRVHQTQILSYLKAAKLPVGLLMNFHAEFLKSQLRRFVL